MAAPEGADGRRGYSLRRRLIATTVGSSVIVGLVSTAIVLAIAWKETSEAFDETLEEGARLILALGEGVAGSGPISRRRDDQGPAMRLDYQIISSDGAVLRRGEDAPERPFVDPKSRDDRFYDARVDRIWWRVHVRHHERLGFSVPALGNGGGTARLQRPQHRRGHDREGTDGQRQGRPEREPARAHRLP